MNRISLGQLSQQEARRGIEMPIVAQDLGPWMDKLQDTMFFSWKSIGNQDSFMGKLWNIDHFSGNQGNIMEISGKNHPFKHFWYISGMVVTEFFQKYD